MVHALDRAHGQVGLFLLSTVSSFLIAVSDSAANQAGQRERNPDFEKIEYLRAEARARARELEEIVAPERRPD